MKIEKISNTQIRCTLTTEDLASRKIRISELAYGSTKARQLFEDMMQQAHARFGFESGNSPLMIEAIPISTDSIVLNITKVDDPEELDTRFSKFSPFKEEDSQDGSGKKFSGADEILDLFHKVNTASGDSAGTKRTQKKSDPDAASSENKRNAELHLIEKFHFRDLDEVISAAHSISSVYNGRNSLLKNSREDGYDLVLYQSDCSPSEFNSIFNILTEYGNGSAFTAVAEAYLLEHGDVMIRNDAIQKLAQI